MEEYDLHEFEISNHIKAKLKDKKWVEEQFATGKSAQKILGFSDKTVAKFYNAAHKLLSRGLYSEAADAFHFLVTLNAKNHEFWLGYGMSLQMLSQHEQAIDCFEMATLLEIESPVPYFYLARCFFAVKEREHGIEALDLAIEYSANRSEYLDLNEQAIQAKEVILGSD